MNPNELPTGHLFIHFNDKESNLPEDKLSTELCISKRVDYHLWSKGTFGWHEECRGDMLQIKDAWNKTINKR